MTPIDHPLGASRGLVLKVAVLDSSDEDLWLAYGTTAQPTSLAIG
jgi:hypothetical protein